MKLSVLASAMAIACLGLVPANAAADCPTASWTGADDTTSWADAGNWSCNEIPSSTTDVTIDAGMGIAGSPVVSTSGQAAQSVTLGAGQTLGITGGSLAVGGTITVPATSSVNVSGGALSFATLQVADSTGLTATAGTLEGDLTATDPTTLTIAGASWGPDTTTIGTNVTIDQTQDMDMEGGTLAIGANTYELDGSSITSNTGTPQITIGSGGTLEHTGSAGGDVQAQVTSAGKLLSTDTGGAGTMTLEDGGAATPGSPTVDELAGTLQASGTGSSLLLAGATFDLDSGGLTVVSPSGTTVGTASGADDTIVALSSQALTLNGPFQHQAGLLSGVGTISGSGTLTLNGGNLAPGPLTGGEMTISAPVDQTSTTDLGGSDGELEIDGTWLSDENLTFSGTAGTFINIGSSGILRHGGGDSSVVDPPVTSAGLIDLPAASTSNWELAGPTTLTGAGSLNVGSQTMTIPTLANLGSGGLLSGGSYSVSGTLKIQDTIKGLGADLSIDGSGQVLELTDGLSALGGMTSIGLGATLTFTGSHSDLTKLGNVGGSVVLEGTSSLSTSGQTMNLLSGAELSGTGTLNGNLINGGTVAVVPSPGALTINGTFTQSPGGQLQIAIDGKNPGQFDILHVTGGVSLGGTLALNPTVGYAAGATSGQSVRFLTYGGTRTGTFTTVSVTHQPPSPDVLVAGYQDAASAVAATVLAPPANSSHPTIAGQTQQGLRLTAIRGTWTNSPTSFSQQWERCNSTGASCVNIAGATATTYLLRAADVGHRLRVVIHASNQAGPTSATSPVTAVIKAPPPPAISAARFAPASVLAKTGTTLHVTLSKPAVVWVTVSHTVRGRVVNVITRKIAAKAGANSLAFKIATLQPGGYTAKLVAHDAGGRTSKTVTLHFTVKQPH